MSSNFSFIILIIITTNYMSSPYFAKNPAICPSFAKYSFWPIVVYAKNITNENNIISATLKRMVQQNCKLKAHDQKGLEYNNFEL